MLALNAATAEDLDAADSLRGHGFEIVRYREERGRFISLRQLDESPDLAGNTDSVGDSFVAVANSEMAGTEAPAIRPH
jgi:competence protein ComEA